MRIELSIHEGVNFLLSHIGYKSEKLEDQLSIYMIRHDLNVHPKFDSFSLMSCLLNFKKYNNKIINDTFQTF